MSEDGSDGSPPRPLRRKIKKVMVVSSASESDSDESVIVASTRRKRMRVVSDGGESSSGSSVGARRRRLPALRDSDAGSDSSGWATDHSDANAAPPRTSGFASDSSEGNSDKCSICLLRFKEQEVGTPETCEHIFCLDCITEWSKNVNTCPVDRITFNSIVVRACMGGRVIRTEPVKVVERRSSVDLLVVEEDPTPCEVCGSTEDEENMLLCDGCDLGYHMQCLTPPLTEVPVGQWLCPNCDDLLDVINLSELNDLFTEINDLELPDGPRMVPLRLPRNVRRSARSISTRSTMDEPSTSSGRRGSGSVPAGGPSTSRGSRATRSSHSNNSTTRRQTAGTQRRKYKRRKNRTVVIEFEVEQGGKFPVTKTVKRKIKKRKSRRRRPRTAARRAHVRASVRAGLAVLRESGPARGQLAPAVPALSLFGNPNELDYFSDEEDDAGGGPAVAARATRHGPSARRQARRKLASMPSPPPPAAAPDLLSDILASQTLLHSRRCTVSVEAGGRLAFRLDVRRAAGGARQAAGGARGGWGGGYRGRPPPAAPHHHHQHYSPRQHCPPPPRAGRAPPPGDCPPAADYSRRPPFDPPPYSRRRPQENGRGTGEAPLDMRRGPPPAPPLPAPPVFRFEKPNDDDDEEPTDLVIDTEKYDPTEPTHDDSPDEEPPAAATAAPSPPAEVPPPPAPSAAPEPLAPPVLDCAMLDSAVRSVLERHGLAGPAPRVPPADSDDDSDGDCPNFNIYSATSVHIASSAALSPPPGPGPAALSPPPGPAALSPPPAARSLHDEYKERVSKRCPITTNTRNPIKIKLNTPSLIRRPVSLYEDEDACASDPDEDGPLPDAGPDPSTPTDKDTECPPSDEPATIIKAVTPNSDDDIGIETHVDMEKEGLDEEIPSRELDGDQTPNLEDEPATPETPTDGTRSPPAAPPGPDDPLTPAPDKSEKEIHSEDEIDETSEKELRLSSASKKSAEPSDDALEKMTESISETEDERSYTPCLDEHKSKDTSLDTDRDRGIEGLDTEMISEEEGNDMFSDEENRPPPSTASPAPAPTPTPTPTLPDKRKRKKDSKKEGKDKKTKKKGDVAFKKLSKNGKERNYRDKEKSKKDRQDSEEPETKRKRKEKRKDLERYDVRTVVTEKRRRKDAFGRDVSPRRSASRSPSPRRRGSPSPRRRGSPSPRRRGSTSPRRRVSASPRRRVSISPRRRGSPSPRRRISISPRRRTSLSPRRRPSVSPRRRPTTSPRRRPSLSPRHPSPSPARVSVSPRRRRRAARPSPSPPPAKRRAERSPVPPVKSKKKKRARSRRREARRKSPKRKRAARSRSPSLGGAGGAAGAAGWSGGSAASGRSPRTPPAPRRHRARRARSSPPAKEVFTSGDNILVSVSFKEPDRGRSPAEGARRVARRRRRRRRSAAPTALPAADAKPVAIIDLERSPFREITPSPKNVIVLSDSDHAEKEAEPRPAPAAAEPEAHAHVGPKTPPEPAAAPAPSPRPATPPGSPDAYDPFEPTRSPSPAPAASPPHLTLEAAQKTNMSADEVLARRPVSPLEKVMALLQSTRDEAPEPPPAPAPAPPAPAHPAHPAPRIVLPEPTRAQPPKLFLAKPSPIKSNPVKPMQATKISRLPLPAPVAGGPAAAGGDSPYSPGSSDFGDLFEPPGGAKNNNPFDTLFDKPAKKHKNKSSVAKVPVKFNRKKGNKTQVGVKIDEDNLKILDDLPNSAVEMQVKSKFLKKLNRQERVVEEVKLVLKPHYNNKRVTKDEYKDILRRAVPKICHNKSGEINPTKIQALVEAYVKKYRKKHKLGLA